MRIKELERLYGIELGNNRYEKNSHLKTQEQLAKEIGMDVRTLQNYKMLEDMIPELDDLVTANIVTKTINLQLDRIYENTRGGDRKSNPNNYGLMSHDKMANLMGISVSTLENYKMLGDMIPELDDLVTAGIVTKTTNPQ